MTANEIIWLDWYHQVPTAKFETYCTMDLKLWPYDVQKCTIKVKSPSLITLISFTQPMMFEHFQFGSWTYSGVQFDLQVDSPSVDVIIWQLSLDRVDINMLYGWIEFSCFINGVWCFYARLNSLATWQRNNQKLITSFCRGFTVSFHRVHHLIKRSLFPSLLS